MAAGQSFWWKGLLEHSVGGAYRGGQPWRSPTWVFGIKVTVHPPKKEPHIQMAQPIKTHCGPLMERVLQQLWDESCSRAEPAHSGPQLAYQWRPEGGVFSSLLLSREKGGIRTSKWEPSGLSKRNVPLWVREAGLEGVRAEALLRIWIALCPQLQKQGRGQAGLSSAWLMPA